MMSLTISRPTKKLGEKETGLLLTTGLQVSSEMAPRENLARTKGFSYLWVREIIFKSKIISRDDFKLQKILFKFTALLEGKNSIILVLCKLTSLNSDKSYHFSCTLED